MQGYIGPYGSLLTFARFKAELTVAAESRSNFETTLGGFVSEQRGPRRKRSWAGNIEGETYAETSQFKALVDGFYGPPPWAMALPYQQVTNMLTPAQALLETGTWSAVGGIIGGGIMTADGIWAGRTVQHATGTTVNMCWTDGAIDYPPAPPVTGQLVTGTVYARGAGNISLQWYDSASVSLGAQNVAYSNADVRRLTITRPAPAGAARVRLVVSGATVVTMPALTWTDLAQPWTPGNGVRAVSVDSLQEQPGDSDTSANGWSDSTLTFRITEIGA